MKKFNTTYTMGTAGAPTKTEKHTPTSTAPTSDKGFPKRNFSDNSTNNNNRRTYSPNRYIKKENVSPHKNTMTGTTPPQSPVKEKPVEEKKPKKAKIPYTPNEPKDYIFPKIGDVILVQGPWTKGKHYFYLVNFSDSKSEWISAFRIHPEGFFYAGNDKLFVPPKYLEAKEKDEHMAKGGYVNIFTGCTSIHVCNVKEVVCHLPRPIYMNIVGGVISMMVGNFETGSNSLTLNDFNIDVKIPISITALLQSIVGIDVEYEVPKETPTIKEEPPKEEKKVEKVADSTKDIIEKQIEECTIDIDSVSAEVLTPKEESKPIIEEVKVEEPPKQEPVRDIKTAQIDEDKLNHLREIIVGFNGRYGDKVPVIYAASILRGKDKVKINSRSFMLSIEEMEEIEKKTQVEITNSAYTKVNGKVDFVTSAYELKKCSREILPLLKELRERGEF